MKWEKVRLGEICEINIGKTPSRSNSNYWGGMNIWVAISDLKGDLYITSSRECITDLAISKSGIKPVQKNTIIYSFKLSIGKVAITQFPIYTNEAIAALPIKDHNKVHLKFLYWALQTLELEGLGDKAVKGVTLNKEKLKNLKISLPPLTIQQRIADILDKADTLRRKDQELTKKYDELAQAIFIEMFGDPVKNEKGWEMKPFEYFVTFDTKMTTDFEKYANVPHIGIGNIQKDSGQLVDYKLVKNEGLESGKYYFTDKHIIYSKIRPNLNKVALPGFDGLCSADSYPLLPTPNSNRIFFAFVLRNKHFLDFISGFSNRANIPKVNKNQLSKYQGMAPPLKLQHQFAKKIELINQLKAKESQSEALFQSLLQKAFTGELVS